MNINDKKTNKDILINQQKLVKNISDMDNIYAEKDEPEKINNNLENRNVYFSPNNQASKVMESSKNLDIYKYLGIPIPESQSQHDNKQNFNKNIIYTSFNEIKTEEKTSFNKNLLKKSTKIVVTDKEPNYNKTRNFNKYSFKKSNTKFFLSNKNQIFKEKKEQKNQNIEVESENQIKDYQQDKKIIKEDINRNVLDNKISIKELSILDSEKIDQKEKYKLIKEYKDKAIFNLFSIVIKLLEEKKNSKLNIENLTKFMLNENYKNYINILKLLIEKERKISEFSRIEKVTDSEIIKYIYRIFSDKYSPFYIKPKKEDFYNSFIHTLSSKLSNITNDTNSNILSHKRYLNLERTTKKSQKRRESRISPKTSNKTNNYEIDIKSPKSKKKLVENKKTMKQFLSEDLEDEEKQKKEFLYQKLNLTKELKYQIEITHDEEGKGRFQMLLDQIEALKNDDIMEYIKFIHEKYENYKKEIKRLINVRDKEERINYFINELIDERTNINKLKKINGKYVSLEDYKF